MKILTNKRYFYTAIILFAVLTGSAFAAPTSQLDHANLTLANFSAIDNHSSLDVVIKQGNQPQVKIIKTSPKFLSLIKTTVSSGTLTINIKPDAPWNAFNDTEIDIYAPHISQLTNSGSGNMKVEFADQLQSLQLQGSGDITAKNITSHNLAVSLSGSGNIDLTGSLAMKSINSSGSGDLDISGINKGPLTLKTAGSGDIDLAGQVSSFTLESTGSGEINADKLIADNVDITLYGSGDINAYAKNSLNIKAYGSDDIDIDGHPKQVSQHIKGSGEVNL